MVGGIYRKRVMDPQQGEGTQQAHRSPFWLQGAVAVPGLCNSSQESSEGKRLCQAMEGGMVSASPRL